MSDIVAGQPGPVAPPAAAPATAGPPRPRGRLFRRYALSFAGLVGLLLLASGVTDAWFSYNEIRATLAAVQQGKAEAAAQRIEQFVAEIERQIGWTTHAQWAAGSVDQRRFDYVRLLRQVPAITELVQLDGQGREQLKVSRLAMDVVGGGTDYASDPRFTEAQRARIWYGPVYFRKESEPYMTLAILRAGRGGGVTLAEVNLKLIWDVVTAVRAGRGGYAYVVDRDGRLIAHPDISLVLRNTDLAAAPQVAAARAAGPPSVGDPPRAELVPGFDGSRVFSAWAPIPQLGWTVFVEQPVREAFEPLIGTLVRTIVLLLLGFVVAAIAAVLFARRMLSPIRALEAGAARLGAGELDHRIDIRTGDELQALADGFNEMGGRLKESYANLERKVEARTHELSEALERQTATSEVLNVISRSTSQLQPVLDAICGIVIRLLGTDHCFVFLFRDGLSHLAAARGGNPEFIEYLRAHPIAPGGNTVVGRITREKRPAYVRDALNDPDYGWKEAARIGRYRSTFGVPLLRQGEVIGAIVLTDPTDRAFTDAQVDLLAGFADQAVIAIENVRLFDEVQARTRELQQALEYQTATSEVLGVISRSTSQLQPVLDAIVEIAHRLCLVGKCFVFLLRDGRFHIAASHGSNPEFIEFLRRNPIEPTAGTVVGRTFLEKRTVYLEDVHADPGFRWREAATRGDFRSMLGVPLLRQGEVIGVLALNDPTVRAFSDQQVALLEGFADQAVIAIENVRLFDEVQARTRELQESLEQQTATSEVLDVITRSPGALEPVFESVLDNATRICDASLGILFRVRDGAVHADAMRNVPPAYADYLRANPQSASEARTTMGRMLAARAPVQTEDLAASDAYRERVPLRVAAVELGGVRTSLAVPMLKESELIGMFVVSRGEVRPFTPKQIELASSFASQAAVAIENVRLLNEVQARTAELQQALEYQTATSQVLEIISRSPTDELPVFEQIVQNATTLCGSVFANVFRYDGEMLHYVATYNTPPAYRELVQAKYPMRPDRSQVSGRVVLENAIVTLEDALVDPEYDKRFPQAMGWRRMLGVPMQRDGKPIGVIAVGWAEPGPVPRAQVELLRTFADQAVIAIENVRLFDEVQARTRELTESLEYQTATSEVLKAISRSTFDLGAVLDALTEAAKRLCRADWAWFLHHDGDGFRVGAGSLSGPIREVAERAARFGLDRATVVGRAGLSKQVVHVVDALADPEYALKAELGTAGARTLLGVPLLRDGALKGVFALGRQRVEAFAPQQIELVSQFADQAVIAMENVRLFDEVQTRTRELQQTLEHQTATNEVLEIISRSPRSLEPVFEAMLESATRICEAQYGIVFHYRDGAFRPQAMRNVPPPYAADLNSEPAYLREIAQESAFGRMMATLAPVEVEDVSRDYAYDIATPIRVSLVELGKARTFLAVPILKEGALIGAFGLYRQEVRRFTPEQIELVAGFANQAVIAIENVRLFDEVQARTAELQESLEQQTATSEVLRVITNSPGELAPVFDSILENASHICDAPFGALFRLRDGAMHVEAMRGVPPVYAEWMRAHPQSVSEARTGVGRVMASKAPVVVVDTMADEAYRTRAPLRMAAVELGGVRSFLAVPMLKEGELIGLFIMYRTELRGFTPKQVELVSGFASQAAVAIENVRLLNEVQARTRELQESLEQQTATSEVLNVITRSPGELTPVFDSILLNATRICDAELGVLALLRDGSLHFEAMINAPPAYADFLRTHPQPVDERRTVIGRVLSSKQPSLVEDIIAHPGYLARAPLTVAAAELGGVRSILAVPLIKDDEAIGVFFIYRREVRPFTQKHVELVSGFASQAAVAIENVRLLNEVQARTRELQESLERQTATSDVLKAISRTTFDLSAVLNALTAAARRLCRADFSWFFHREGDGFRLEATALDAAERAVAEKAAAMGITRGTLVGRTALERGIVHIVDTLADPEYMIKEATGAANIRTVVGVPLIRDGVLLGVFSLGRLRTEPFTPQQIDLLTGFADQAVIAMENVRLFEQVQARTRELGQSVEELRALGEVSQTVNSTLDAQTVLRTIVAKAVEISGTEAGVIYVWSNRQQAFRMRASHGGDEALTAAIRRQRLDSNSLLGDAARQRVPLQVPELRDAAAAPIVEQLLAAGYRALLIVPLIASDRVIGALVLRRKRPGAFAERTVDLMRTFAAQSVVAIQNARLFGEIEEKGRQLELASQHKSQFLANMSHELRTPLNAVLGYAELMADGVYGDLSEKANGVLARIQSNGRHLLGLINDVLDLSKIEAGQLTLTLDDYTLPGVVQSVISATESLASAKGLTLGAEIQPGLPLGRGDERRLTQVLLNIVGNAIKFTDQGGVTIAAARADDVFEIGVTDTGPGIAPEHQARIFEEFQQVDDSSTRKKGGSGLGLAISRKIVELHGGTIAVRSAPGAGATFTIRVPVRVEAQKEIA